MRLENKKIVRVSRGNKWKLPLVALTLSLLAWPLNASNLEQFRPGSVTWAGYTSSTYTGDLGGHKGFHDKCQAAFSGSHSCSYEELMALGSKYPYTYRVWIQNVTSYLETVTAGGASVYYYSLKGGYGMGGTSSLDLGGHICGSWGFASASYSGPIFGTTGFVSTQSCNLGARLACCY